MHRINISVSYWKLYKLFVLGLCFLKIFFTQWSPLLNSFKFSTSMEEFQISYVVYELSIWTQLHEIIFIHDCLDCFPSSCNLTDVLSMSFCLTFPTRAWMGRLFFLYFDIFLKEDGAWIQSPSMSVGILPLILTGLGWQKKPKTLILESVLPFSEWELLKTFSDPVTEAPHHKDGSHFHLLILLITTVVLIQAVPIISLKNLDY